jgi:multiple sugar transport system permease protein
MSMLAGPSRSRRDVVRPRVAARAGGGARRRIDLRARRELARIPFLLPTAFFVLLLSIYPFIRLVQMSLSDVSAGNLLTSWPFVGFDNFSEVLASPDFRSALGQTAGFVVVVLVLSLGGGMLAACVMQRQVRVGRLAQSLMLLTWALPPVVTGSLWKFLFASEGGVNALLHVFGFDSVPFLVSPSLALWSVAFVTSWVSAPFAAVVLRSALLDVPRETLEAAAVDGAGPIRAFRYVTLPQLMPTVMVLSVLIVVYAFRSFDFIYVMTDGGPAGASTTIPFLGYQQAFTEFAFGEAGATGVVALLLVLFLTGLHSAVTRKGRVAA